MQRLLIMRHATAQYANRQSPDRQRALTDVGRAQAAQMACLLRDRNEVPVRMLHSDAVRCRETATVMLAQWRKGPQIVSRKDLYLAGAGHLASVATEEIFAANREGFAAGEEVSSAGEIDLAGPLLVLAHNPGVSEVMRLWSGGDPEARSSALRTADIAVFERQDAAVFERQDSAGAVSQDAARSAFRFVELLRSEA
ncbi:MAG: histidine phosphatase family protein [Planctomycetota bacterium]